MMDDGSSSDGTVIAHPADAQSVSANLPFDLEFLIVFLGDLRQHGFIQMANVQLTGAQFFFYGTYICESPVA